MKTKIIGFRRFLFAAFLIVALIISTSDSVVAEELPECAEGDHVYSVTITKEATETKDGERTYKCEICGYSYVTTIPATGHQWGEWITDKEPTCCTEGHRYRVCTKYPDSPHTQEESIPSTGAHDYVEKITKEPTCEEDGIKTFTCTLCGSVYTEQLPATGHNFGEWTIDKNPTKEEEGHRYRICTNDSTHIEEEMLPVLSSSVESRSSGQNYTMDILFTTGFLGMTSVFACAIYSDLRLIFWVKKKRKAFVKEMSTEWYDV